MIDIRLGVASSHAFALWKPEIWDEERQRNREAYERRWGTLPPENAGVDRETLAGNRVRYEEIAQGFDQVGKRLAELEPDVCIIFGDDQHELFTEMVPQFAIYTGSSMDVLTRRSGEKSTHQCDPELARHLLNVLVAADFDVTDIRNFPDGAMFSHAIEQIINFYDLQMPVIPVYVNAICPPAPSPGRCYAFGGTVREALDSFPNDRRALLYGSGGLSHFTVGYPYSDMLVPADYGSIAEDFDQQVMTAVREGRGDDLAKFDSNDFLDNGEIETRQWVTMLGALRNARPNWVKYGAFYRGVMGMGVAMWEEHLEQPAPSR